jgi:hypothetical protein
LPEVYRYTAGKLDWLAADLPVEGAKAGAPRIARWAHTDVPTCGLDDSIDLVQRRARAGGWDIAVVLNAARVVLGVWQDDNSAPPAGVTAAAVMRPAPVTVRPHLPPDDVPEAARKQDGFLVTTSDGVLIGLVRSADLEAACRATDVAA